MTNLYVALPLLVALLYAVLFLVVGLHTLKPRKGTLEWIYDFDLPYTPFEKPHSLLPRDLLLMLIPLAVGIGTVAAEFFFLKNVPLMQFLSPALSIVFATVGAYLFFYWMTQSRSAAVLGSVLLALTSLQIEEKTFFFLLTVLSLWLWCSGEKWWTLVMGALSFALTVYFAPEASDFGLLFLLFLFLAIPRRAEREGRSVGGSIGSVAVAILTFLLAVPLTYLPSAILSGLPFPGFLTTDTFWKTVAYLLLAPRYTLFYQGRLDSWLTLHGLLNLPCIALTLSCIPLALVTYIKKRRSEALFLFLLSLNTVALFIASVDLTVICGPLVLAYFGKQILRREKLPLAIFVLALPILGAVASYAASYFI